MAVTVLVISLILTVIILLLSLLTISKGYGYKHKVDPPVTTNEFEVKSQKPNEKLEENN